MGSGKDAHPFLAHGGKAIGNHLTQLRVEK